MKKAIKLVAVVLSCFVVLSLLFPLAPAMAHKMYITYRAKEIEVLVEFGGGSVAREARVIVLDPNGEVYVEGVTDEEGKFSFELGEMEGKWKITAEHSGHKKTVLLESSEAQSEGGLELPLYTRIIAGFGYLVGIAGVALVIMSRKVQRGIGSDRISSD
ncbi:MAG: hypothetical protein DDT28_00243 [Dehalococcoidia bacterium]|nr:hypothetical protein [Chloroflexota bacterium]MBT9159126.1 hypothetical protein [Chloroflexota bacterium]